MGAGLLAVKSGFILFIKSYQFPLQINTLERECHCTHFDTSPPGAFGRNGFHGESARPDEAELGLLRAHWIIEPPFVDRKSLATMSNTGDVGG